MRNVNESQVRAYLLTHGVIEGLKLEGIEIAEIRRYYNEVDNFVSILMEYGTMLSNFIDKAQAESGKEVAGVNITLCDSVAPAWLVGRLLESAELNAPSKAQWHYFSENLANAFYSDKLNAFSNMDVDKQMRPGLEFDCPKVEYSEEAIRYHLDKFGSSLPIGEVLYYLERLPKSATHINLHDLSFAVYWLKRENGSWALWAKAGKTFHEEFVWIKPDFVDGCFIDKLVPLRDLQVRKILGSNQEEREMMFLPEEGQSLTFTEQRLDPAIEHETYVAPHLSEQSVEIKTDRELSKPQITNVHELTTIRIDGAVITVDSLKKTVNIVSEYCDLIVNDQFTVSGSVSNL
ncbi:1-deoxy-D-xylulose-5-phosphate synthase [Vibrio phage SHOU24]|uniref:1-deoxy-D-xylulose-5-phosphate synthase n=1 Tax=Vibrio phage SHOU24 TaxID=1414739 RepID=UPI0003ED1DA3|nr:1-deoxy-D-xylulose-5-phosphate synthase [Vibrio phage SHOU24]AHI61200.1 1-deoxy-D-xylulose-5-phosphate synthase [Vibrio phage SHOU24]